MSKWDKLLKRIASLSGDLRFDELCKVMQSYGYEVKSSGSGGSHFTFSKKGSASITIPKHQPVKTIYVKMIRDIVESEEAGSHEND